ncbi:Putative Zinc finger protein [Septoria linicola]|uniref:type I protein arginine methyltransferase n=1 Tax=Septoria linicola TaxID=215465 RepID=A0A9Q9EGP7_9PEZI|nr:putative Zinc finger protein [Septoria linicola]USW49052.1 Putative Zinc finger protein [Septoria linicola]
MPDLPHGWRMRNSQGEKVGPPVEEDGNYQFSGDDDDQSGSNAGSEPDIELAGLDLKPDSEGWNDVEDDTEDVSIKCLFCEEVFGGAKGMNEHSTKVHEFDLAKVQGQHDLDFYSSMKLVNYLRAEVKAGKTKPDVSDASAWADDKYLQPTLEDDALLFNLDDIDERPVPDADATKEGAGQSTDAVMSQ